MRLKLPHDSTDFLQNSFSLLHHFTVRESEYSDALRFQPSITSGIVARIGFIEMLTAVHFNGEVEGWCVEVKDIVSERVLAKEAHVMNLSASQVKPKRLLGVCEIVA